MGEIGEQAPEFVKRHDFDMVLAAETSVIARRRENPELGLGKIDVEKEPPIPESSAKTYRGEGTVGLAFSGGGIRSATFCLGVMQRLAKDNLLRHVDYLSTVSGGGYIGSALTWFLSVCNNASKRFGVGPNDLPFGTVDPRRAPLAALGAAFKTAAAQQHDATPNEKILRYLRQHGEYLTPGKGITLLSGAAIVLRAMLLNLFMATAVSACILYLMMRAILVCPTAFEKFAYWAEFLEWKAHCVAARAGGESLEFAGACGELFAAAALHLALYLFVLFFAACAVYSLCTASEILSNKRQLGYYWRRVFEKTAKWLLVASGLSLILAALPWADGLVAEFGETESLALLLPGMASGFWTFIKSLGEERADVNGKRKEWVPVSLVACVAAVLVLFGVTLTGYQVAEYLVASMNGAVWVTVLFVGTFFLSVVVDLNRISIHRFYRDRLMETFLPDPGEAAANATGASWRADVAAISGMAHACGPYHIINTNLVTVDSEDRRLRLRGGDSFVFSPLFCGARSIGWRSMKWKGWADFSLATAMAISGAAANPNAGSGGVGVTRNRLVSLAMTLLAVRLGYWVRNSFNRLPRLRNRPNHLSPALSTLVFGRLTESNRWLQLSDGGHFENLGLYELFRRRCRLIVSCDGGADPNYEFEDLQNAVQRAADDFGVRIQFNDSSAVERLRPKRDSRFWSAVKVADRGYAVATIHYPEEPNKPGSACEGTLIFLTTTLIDDMGMNLLGYSLVNPAFPDQGTADQFFDEMQFEAYRELGWCIAEQMLAGTQMKSVNVPGKGHYLAVP